MYTCRACLSSLTQKNMIPLDETFVQQYNMLTHLNVALMDGMPQCLCQNCKDTVKQYVEFKERCISSESTLQLMVLQQIKSENLEPCTETVPITMDIEEDFDLVADHGVKVEPDIIEEYLEPFDDDEHTDANFKYESEVKEIRKSTRKTKPQERYWEEVSRIELDNRLKKNELKPSKQVQVKTEMDCGLCKRVLKSADELKQHLDAHRTDKTCKLCPESFDRWPTLITHRFAHSKTETAEYRCHICNKLFRTLPTIEYHYLNEHYDGENKRLRCSICLGYYNSPLRLKKHVQVTHSSKRFTCEICNKILKNKQCYKSHKLTHSEIRGFQCDKCDFASKTPELLGVHKIRRHTSTSVKCRKCTRVFRNQENFDAHLARCDLSNKVCAVCGKVLYNHKALQKHMVVHSAEPTFKCKLCPKAFRARGSLTAHMDRHAGNRRNKCEHCSFRAYTRSVLLKHVRTHTGVKPYVCEICQRAFTGNHNLKVHMKVHGLDLVVKKVPSVPSLLSQLPP